MTIVWLLFLCAGVWLFVPCLDLAFEYKNPCGRLLVWSRTNSISLEEEVTMLSLAALSLLVLLNLEIAQCHVLAIDGDMWHARRGYLMLLLHQ